MCEFQNLGLCFEVFGFVFVDDMWFFCVWKIIFLCFIFDVYVLGINYFFFNFQLFYMFLWEEEWYKEMIEWVDGKD